MRTRLILSTTSLILLIGHLLGLFAQYYSKYPTLDVYMHFLGGVWIVSLLFFIIYRYPQFSYLKGSRMVNIILTTGLVVLIGVFWEFFEFGVSFIAKIPFAQNVYQDTIADLFLEIAGSFITAFLILQRSAQSPT